MSAYREIKQCRSCCYLLYSLRNNFFMKISLLITLCLLILMFLDGQFNVMPSLNGKPLNGVEFQEALSKNYDRVVLLSLDKVDKREYTDFVYDYLYYFDTALDNRLLPADKKYKIDGKRSLMLVPTGAANPTKIGIFNTPIDYCVYTHSLNDFYAVPE